MLDELLTDTTLAWSITLRPLAAKQRWRCAMLTVDTETLVWLIQFSRW